MAAVATAGAAPRFMSRSEFARHIGHAPSWVTKLGHQGRLVTDRAGARVDVPATLAAIEASRDPSKVTAPATEARRKQAAAARKKIANYSTAQIVPAAPAVGAAGNAGGDDATSPAYARARAIREGYNARLAKLQYERMSGDLVPREAVAGAAATLGAAIRARLDRLADEIAPALAGAGGNENALHRIVTDAVDQVLADVASLMHHAVDVGASDGAESRRGAPAQSALALETEGAQ